MRKEGESLGLDRVYRTYVVLNVVEFRTVMVRF